MPPPDTNIRLYIVIVLYKMEPAASPTFRTLLQSLEEPTVHKPAYRILLYDNTPSAQNPPHLPGQVEYFASPVNTGLADAYNLAVVRAQAAGFDWLLTLDQDTDLPPDFIPKMAEVAETCKTQQDIAAIVPHIRAGHRDVSPNWFAGGVRPRWFPRGYHDVPDRTVYAFNSGTMVRVSAVQAVGGYSRLFWLDYCDAYLFRQIEKQRWKVFVAGRVHLQHDFSMLDVANKMSLWRYQNAVEAGSAFYDLEMSPLAGLEHTLRLLGRYLKHLLRGESRQVRSITAFMLRQRLFVSRARRIKAWNDSQQRRIATYGGGYA
jgi:glycosyltransferase involved in cell wall biosynthesis